MVDLVDIDLSLCPEFIEISTVSALSCRVHCLFTRPNQGAYRATIFQLHRVLKDLGQRSPKGGGRLSGLFQESDNRRTAAPGGYDIARVPRRHYRTPGGGGPDDAKASRWPSPFLRESVRTRR